MNKADFSAYPFIDGIHAKEYCAHCGTKVTLEDYKIGILIKETLELKLYCTIRCQLGHTLDALMSSNALDDSWTPILQQIHDQLEPKKKEDGV